MPQLPHRTSKSRLRSVRPAARAVSGEVTYLPVATQRRALPTGTVTFLFTDIEGSTRLWEQHCEAMWAALARHDAILTQVITAHRGVIVKTTGDGAHAVFTRATDALAAALVAQRALQAEEWDATGPLRVRMALHTGVADVRDGDYYGMPLNRVARLLASGHGGQVLLSRATWELVRDQLPAEVELRDLGVYRLRDLTHPEQIFQVVAPDLPADFPPLTPDVTIPGTRRSAISPSHTALSGQQAARSDHNRRRMLAKVKAFWVTGVLENSLHGAALLALGMEPIAHAVAYPWEMIVQQPDYPARPLPPGSRIAEIFDALDGEVLILGAPGAGKTTLLLALGRDLIARAEQDASYPMPVVFNLSAWAERRQPLATWFVDELNIRYGVPQKIGAAWIEADQVLPLLDGLDEVPEARRAACVEAINTFRQDHGLVHVVVCSRYADYTMLTVRLKLQGAILVQPLNAQQIDAYVASAGDQLTGLRTALAEDAMLRELAQSPLMLSIMTLAYQSTLVETLPAVASIEMRRKHLFAAYVERMFARRGADTYYSRPQTIRWLAWLAQALLQRDQTIFFIEQMQPQSLLTGAQHRHYAIGVGLGVGLIAGVVVGLSQAAAAGPVIGLVVGLMDGLVAGLSFGLVVGLAGGNHEAKTAPTHGLWRSLLRALGIGLAAGLVVGLLGGLIFGLVVGMARGLVFGLGVGSVAGVVNGLLTGLVRNPGQIEVVETLRWSWAKARLGLAGKLTFALSVGVVVGLVDGLVFGQVVGLASALATALTVGLLVGLVSGLTGGEIETKTVPNQGMWRSARNALYVGTAGGAVAGLTIGLVFALAYGLSGVQSWWSGLLVGLPYGLSDGLAVGLLYGGLTCIQHVVLRIILNRNGHIPWNYARFLDYATERIFLHKVGGGYIFVHRLLLEHFATKM